MTVGVEIRYGNRLRIGARSVGYRRAESSISLTQEDGDVKRTIVGHRQVFVPVAAKIPHCYGSGMFSSPKAELGAESPIPAGSPKPVAIFEVSSVTCWRTRSIA